MVAQLPDPVTEATVELANIVRDANLGKIETRLLLRRCGYVANLIGDLDRARYFNYQLNGFPEESEVPSYRVVSGEVRWTSQTTGWSARYTNSAGQSREQEIGLLVSPNLVVRMSLDEITARAEGHGEINRNVALPDHEQAIRAGRRGGQQIYTYERVSAWNFYRSERFRTIINRIDEDAIEWASQTLIRLKYESRISSIWEKRRSLVDSKLEELNLGQHLAAIDEQVASDNPEMWRAALLACRNALQDVADYLWKVNATKVMMPEYGSAKEKMMDCNLNNYVMRLKAYLRYNHVDDTGLTLSTAEADFLGNLIGRVNNFDNRGHAAVSKETAEAGALYTYMVLADLIRLTDMEPLTELPEGTFTS